MKFYSLAIILNTQGFFPMNLQWQCSQTMLQTQAGQLKYGETFGGLNFCC